MKALLIPLLLAGCATCVPPLTCPAPIQQSHSTVVAEVLKVAVKPPAPKPHPTKPPGECKPHRG
jgi:hypothetical protein